MQLGAARTDKVTEVRNVIDVGQRAGDEDVALASLWEDGLLGLLHIICTCGQRELYEASDRLQKCGTAKPYMHASLS